MKKKIVKVIFQDQMPLSNRIRRLIWNLIWTTAGGWSPVFLYEWRNFLLSIFGACIGKGVHVYPSAQIWAPWNLEMGDGSSLGPGIICYSVDQITIGKNTTVSQYAHLCTASHDIEDPQFHLTTKPIVLGNNVWIATEAFVGPGVKVGEGAVVGARAAVFKNVKSWDVVGGNPAKVIKKRKIFRKKRY